mmetsp:Transcript_5773/g.17169  ORF Transcript_5773/g.17169 Transcript_5773/m.17169 type:complete len:232 (+) Transcript_5773:1167-1862(+)
MCAARSLSSTFLSLCLSCSIMGLLDCDRMSNGRDFPPPPSGLDFPPPPAGRSSPSPPTEGAGPPPRRLLSPLPPGPRSRGATAETNELAASSWTCLPTGASLSLFLDFVRLPSASCSRTAPPSRCGGPPLGAPETPPRVRSVRRSLGAGTWSSSGSPPAAPTIPPCGGGEALLAEAWDVCSAVAPAGIPGPPCAAITCIATIICQTLGSMPAPPPSPWADPEAAAAAAAAA